MVAPREAAPPPPLLAPPPAPRAPAPLPPPVPAAAAAAAAADIIGTEQPSSVRVRLWRTSPRWLESGGAAGPHGGAPSPLTTPLLSIPDAALCSEMGVHFSPDGRRLALVGRAPVEEGGYELRVISVGGLAAARGGAPRPLPPGAGALLAHRPVRAAHCLTSVQWSPTGQHILLAYGRRHASLVAAPAGGAAGGGAPAITVLEIYCARTLARVYDFPSAVHEVNAAAFHPVAGRGLAFGTKDGAVCVLACE